MLLVPSLRRIAHSTSLRRDRIGDGLLQLFGLRRLAPARGCDRLLQGGEVRGGDRVSAGGDRRTERRGSRHAALLRSALGLAPVFAGALAGRGFGNRHCAGGRIGLQQR